MFNVADIHFKTMLYELLDRLGYRFMNTSSKNGTPSLKVPREVIRKATILYSQKTNFWFALDRSHIKYIRVMPIGSRVDKMVLREQIVTYLAHLEARRYLSNEA